MNTIYNLQTIKFINYDIILTCINCIRVIIKTLSFFPPLKLFGLIIIPFICAFLNNHINNILIKDDKNIITCLFFKVLSDYIHSIIQHSVFYSLIRLMNIRLKNRLQIAKIYCGVTIPGIILKEYDDLIDDQTKLKDFLFVLPMFWSFIVNFSITIYMMKISSKYPIRSLFSIFCILMCGLITYLTDSSIYENMKPSVLTIFKLNDARFVHLKMSMGCLIDTNFEENRYYKIQKQHDIQKYIIICINFLTTLISLLSNNIGQIHSFGNISWMIGCLADNIKSLQYYTYMDKFIIICECLEKHKLICNETSDNIINFKEIKFINASFGYYTNLIENSKYEEKITSLTYTFKIGYFYYLEAQNGLGKSTIMRMFRSNLKSGHIFFDNINRNNLSFINIYSLISHIVQASEYTPKFSKKEIDNIKGKDLWLEKQLKLEELFGKSTVEMSSKKKY